jgi:TRAP-type C4-dicarboxylate transport system substrate-binding protein
MPPGRRTVLGAALAAPALIRPARAAPQPRTLHISHHFPQSDGEHGDFRDRLVRRFAADVTARSNGALSFEIYPGGTLMRPAAQFSGLRHGALDLTLCPLAFGAHDIPEAAIGMVPGMVTTDAQAAAWKNAEAGRHLATTLVRHGVRILSWAWLPCAIASGHTAVTVPTECRDLRIRSGSPPMAETLKAAGARAAPLLSEAVTKALRKGQIDAAVVSSTSLISFRVQESAGFVTTARNATCGYSLEPLLVSEQLFMQLPRDQQGVLVAAGAAQDAFAAACARADANAVGDIFAEAGRTVHDLDQDNLQHWISLAVTTGWKSFAAGSPACAELLRLAAEVPA